MPFLWNSVGVNETLESLLPGGGGCPTSIFKWQICIDIKYLEIVSMNPMKIFGLVRNFRICA
jgi:hypothetical protein